jgi:hypothetical protein
VRIALRPLVALAIDRRIDAAGSRAAHLWTSSTVRACDRNRSEVNVLGRRATRSGTHA